MTRDHDAGDGEGPQLEDTQQHEEAVRWPLLHSQVGLYVDRSKLYIDNQISATYSGRREKQ